MIDIAILGCGTVGGGVAELLETNCEQVKAAAGDEVRVKYILDIRDFKGTKYENLVVNDINIIVNDPDIKIICETMGGKEPACSYSKLALEHGISVCTSNKELVDFYGAELSEIAKKNNCSYLFEASVGGGTPLLRTLKTLRHEKIDKVMGILNGTCNYILTKMKYENMELADALKIAQDKGYAERNPDADILGYDTARKIAILASLVSGKRVHYESVKCEGITKIDKLDFKYAEKLNANIKLLGVYNQGCEVIVAPFLIPNSNALYGVNEAYNAILFHGNMLSDAMIYGSGAGRYPTASAVVSDVIELAHNLNKFIYNGLSLELNNDIKAERKFKFLVRAAGQDALSAFGNNITELESINSQCAFITEAMTGAEFDAKAAGLDIKNKIRILEAI